MNRIKKGNDDYSNELEWQRKERLQKRAFRWWVAIVFILAIAVTVFQLAIN